MRCMRSMAVLVLAGIAACDRNPIDPAGTAEHITFRLNGAARTLTGAPAPNTAELLMRSFVVARADSLDGIIAIGFEATGDGEGNLLVLQAPRATGEYGCRDGMSNTPCHARYIEGVRNGSTAAADRYYHAVDGSVTVTQIGPDRLRGSFSLTLHADDGKPGATIVLQGGSIDVPYSSDSNSGVLECLLASMGIGAGPCSGG